MSSMEGMWLRAWIDGLHRLNNGPAVRPVEHPTGSVLLPMPTTTPTARTARYAPPDPRRAPR